MGATAHGVVTALIGMLVMHGERAVCATLRVPGSNLGWTTFVCYPVLFARWKFSSRSLLREFRLLACWQSRFHSRFCCRGLCADGNHQGTNMKWFNKMAAETMSAIGGCSQQW